MYKPGQLITIDNNVYRITRGFFACFYCHHLNDFFTPKSCNMCRHKIPNGMFPLHISIKIQDNVPIYVDNPIYEKMRKEKREEFYKSILCGKPDK